MKEFFKMFFASMLANIVGGLFMIFIFIIVVAGIAAAVSGGVKGGKSKEGNVLVIDLSDRIKENDESNELAVLDDESDLKTGLYNTCKTIEDAKNNSEIKGIYLKLNNARNSWATLQQLREALVSFKKSGKFIVSYGEVISQRAYYVASAGTAIYLNPSGDLEHKGMAATLAFYKGLLDKLDIQPEIFYAGKFKSATEPFRADKMSEPNRLQITQLINGMWSEYLLAAAEFTKSDTATLHKLAYQQAINFPSDAFNNKMVTALYYWDQVEAAMKDKVGKDIKYITLNDYASKHIDLSIKATNKIAVLVAEGSIVDGQQTDDDQIASKNFCEEIRKIKNNDSVKAVVLRINSPGGSALASEVILRELTLLQQKKHIVVSMGDYAASGGYYIASLADSI
ncbi:MAG: signal peptide peptidase SppA, partial [Chitinophagia bacterium]|nr:signal peptide peptidase SppA [Chitinophagia bacterium]